MSGIFIFLSLFFPRLTLLFTFCLGAIPANTTPFLVDVVAAIFAPRLLIAWWMYELNMHPVLIAVFVLVEFYSMFKTTISVKKEA